MTSGTPAAIAASNGGEVDGVEAARERPIVTIASSVFAGAAPSPGKCFAVAATPPARQPRDRVAHRVARDARVARERPAGERRAAHARNVGDRRERDRDAGRAERTRCGHRIRAHGAASELLRLCGERARPGQRVAPFRLPGRPQRSAGRPARRRSRVSARSCSGPVMLPPNRITPATRFSRSASRT